MSYPSGQMDICLNCGGAILLPNIAYGYAGPICYCPKNPAHQYQRPASKETQPQSPKSPAEGLDHPCKETCSGWKQGYELGVIDGSIAESSNWISLQEEYAHVKKRAEAAERLARKLKTAIEDIKLRCQSSLEENASESKILSLTDIITISSTALAKHHKDAGARERKERGPAQGEESGMPQ